MTWSDSSRFEGEWVLDQRFKGVMSMIDGSSYEGCFKNDVYSGFGTLRMIDGTIFSGIFIEGKCPKIGWIEFEEGDIYEGEVDDFKPEGLGKMTHALG